MSQIIMSPVLMALAIPFYIAGIPLAYATGKLRSPVLSFFASAKENLKLPQFRIFFFAVVLMFGLIVGLYIQFAEDVNFVESKMTLIRIAFLLLIILAVIILYLRVSLTEGALDRCLHPGHRRTLSPTCMKTWPLNKKPGPLTRLIQLTDDPGIKDPLRF